MSLRWLYKKMLFSAISWFKVKVLLSEVAWDFRLHPAFCWKVLISFILVCLSVVSFLKRQVQLWKYQSVWKHKVMLKIYKSNDASDCYSFVSSLSCTWYLSVYPSLLFPPPPPPGLGVTSVLVEALTCCERRHREETYMPYMSHFILQLLKPQQHSFFTFLKSTSVPGAEE